MPTKRAKEAESAAAYALNVRPYRPEDAEGVRRICRAHFRSLCVPAVEYYCLEHFRDLVALLVIGKIFQSWRDLGLAVALFIVYLFVRARVELELYIRRDCPDLDDIEGYYIRSNSEGRSNFWVAEASAKSQEPGAAPKVEVVGCVGCCPAKDDSEVAQLLRLVVAEGARRMRNGSRLLAQFENFAREKGFREVRLYTNNLNTNHMQFVRQRGYDIVQQISRTLMRGSLVQWKKVFRPKPVAPESTMADAAPVEGRARSNTIAAVMD